MSFGLSPMCQYYFYPRPPRGGRRLRTKKGKKCCRFLSTPSARRATVCLAETKPGVLISIHALREEGDLSGCNYRARDLAISIHALREEGDCCTGVLKQPLHKFLSTPSARRATRAACRPGIIRTNFYPRPPRGGRLKQAIRIMMQILISIHALREEGDFRCKLQPPRLDKFLSTPSARRATIFILQLLP